MQRSLICAAIFGALLIGNTNFVLAVEGAPKEGETQAAPKARDTQAPVTKAIDQKPASSEESKKEVEQLKKADKPDKKPGCQPGSLSMMGVGC